MKRLVARTTVPGRRRVGQWLPKTAGLYQLVWGPFTITLDWVKHKGYWALGTRASGACGLPNDAPATSTWERPVEKRRVKTDTAGAAPAAASATKVFQRFPCIVAHCTVTAYSTKEPRRPGWITIRTRGTVWEVIAKDPDACASLQVAGPTLDDTLVLMEGLLSAEDAPWEHDQYLQMSSRRGRKK